MLYIKYKIRFAIIATMVLFLGVWTNPAWSGDQSKITIKPGEIHIDTLFNGCTVTISGKIPKDEDVVIEIAGPEEKAMFDIKGRFGPFWMNRNKLEMAHAPNLYALLLPDRSEVKDNLIKLGLGWEDIKHQIAIEPANLGLNNIFEMFINLKKSQGLYQESAGAVTYGQPEGMTKPYQATFSFPSSTSVGNFKVTATMIQNGAKNGSVSRNLTVRETGFIKFIHVLAFDNALIYGVFSVIIALLAGAIMGVMFKSGGSH